MSHERMDETMEMAAIRDQLLTLLAKHEKESHKGAICCGNRSSAIGYLAHCIGLDTLGWLRAREYYLDYEESCPNRGVPHSDH